MAPQKAGLLAVALALAVGAAVYGSRYYLKPAPAAPGLSSAPIEAPAALPPSLPPLEDSDEFVRGRAAALSSAPAFREWLKQGALIPRLAAAMNLVASGAVPRDAFAAFAPRGKFAVVRTGGRTRAAPAAFARYDAFAAMVQSVDAAAAARLFTELLPLFDAAQRALGDKSPGARAAFIAAARELLQAPVPGDDVVLVQGKKGLGWIYADERLEELSLAQKQLMRMGPKNQAAVQDTLRAVLLALGN